jgi:hypothetical protein
MLVAGFFAATSFAFEVHQHAAVHDKQFQDSRLWWTSVYRPAHELPLALVDELQPGLDRLGVASEHAYFDRRSGRWGTLILTRPMIPGPGVGNDLRWSDAGLTEPRNPEAAGQAAWNAFHAFLTDHSAELRFDPDEFARPRVSAQGERLIRIHLPRQYAGVPVRDSFVTASINSGNLVLMGQRNWADLDLDTRPSVSSDQALDVVRGHLDRDSAPGLVKPPRLEIIPVSDQPDDKLVEQVGQGLNYRLVWVLLPIIDHPHDIWEALVDARNGQLLAFEDQKHYTTRKIGGGVFPVSNDGIPPDGIEQPDWPMPFADVRVDGSPVVFSTSGGHLPPDWETELISTTLTGQYVNMADSCGSINEAAASGDLDLGDGPGTDCAVPPGASPGNTHASRSGFYELNRIAEQGRGYLPGNTWLQNQLTANMNLNDNCNAWFSPASGQVGFFTSGGGCANTGEIAAVFDHEWGHGMDFNSNAAGISRPGEGIADIYAQNRLNDSCVGRGFRPGQNCGGFGDACLECTGVRESDWAKQASGQPHDVAWILANCPAGSNTPCGRSTHCEGSIVAESAWDLVHRDLRGFNFGFDLNTALELGTRLTFLGATNVVNWYQCVTDGTAGCNADSGYLNYLAADDDNGDLTDGTPHMSAIFAAFDRHQIACPTPVVQDSGCAGGPALAPQNIVTTPLDQGAHLAWDAVSDADQYWIFRTEGVQGCDFGKTRVGMTSDTQFVDDGLRNDMEVLYSVVAVGSNDACTSPMSSCQAVTPFPGPSGVIEGVITRAATDIPLTGALVQVSGDMITRSAMTDAGGAYQVTVLEGVHEVSVSRDGHLPQAVAGIEVNDGDAVTLDFALDTPIARVQPLALELEAAMGGFDTAQLSIDNLGTLAMDWQMTTDAVSAGRGHDPELDEPLSLDNFTVDSSANGGGPVARTATAGLDTRGEVVGFSFEGTVSGISGSSSWAADLCMIVASPDGATYGVGGYSGTQSGCNVNGWDFGGEGSSGDGFYAHSNDPSFDPPVADEGEWTFTFINDWNNSGAATMNWSEVTITLHKQPLPICQDPEAAVWLSSHPDAGVIAAGGSAQVSVSGNAEALPEGIHEAYLCVTTNDVDAPLLPVPVVLTVIEPPPGELSVVPDLLEFGELDANDIETLAFEVANAAISGALGIEISSISINPGDSPYTISGGDCQVGTELEGGQQCQVEVMFSPAMSGQYEATVTIETVQGQATAVSLTGIGAQDPGEVQFSPTGLAFGDVATGRQGLVELSLANVAPAGSADLAIAQMLVVAGQAVFAVDGTDCGPFVAPGQSCAIVMGFSPQEEVAHAGVLRLTIDGDNYNLSLTGRGVAPEPLIYLDRFENMPESE